MMARESYYTNALCPISKANEGPQMSCLELHIDLLVLRSAYLAVLIGLGSKFPCPSTEACFTRVLAGLMST